VRLNLPRRLIFRSERLPRLGYLSWLIVFPSVLRQDLYYTSAAPFHRFRSRFSYSQSIGVDLHQSEKMSRRKCNWEGSWVDEDFLESLTARGLLPPKDQCEWRAAGEEVIPDPQPGEVVIFTEHVERGFKPPGSLFFCSLMQRLGLRFHDIGPNSMLQVSNFHVLCEGLSGYPAFNRFLACSLQLQ
jgi:hypothetical protein